MAIYHEGNKIGQIYYGSNKIGKVYYGSQLVYESFSADPILGNNSWAKIKQACKLGKASQFWSVGDTKTMVGTDGNTYTIRITDMQEGRYAYASDGSYTHCTFEFVECVPTSVGIASGNAQTYGQTTMYTALESGAVYTIMSQELKDELEDVNIKCASTHTASWWSAVSDVPCKLFLAAAGEMVNDDALGDSIEKLETQSYKTGANLGIFDYYKSFADPNYPTQDYPIRSARIKSQVVTSSNVGYWLRTPYTGNAYFQYISSSGEMLDGYRTWTEYRCPCFAF